MSIFLLLAMPCGVSYAKVTNAGAEERTPQQVVEAFCQDEFTGIDLDTRASIIHYSKAREKIERKRPDSTGGWAPYSYSFVTDPFVIVSEFKAGEVTTDDKSGVGTIMYHVIGKSLGNLKLVITKAQDETVSLKLRKMSNQWKVVDPPEPKVSYKIVLQQYEDLLKNEATVLQHQPSDHQKDYFKKLNSAVDAIKQMAAAVE